MQGSGFRVQDLGFIGSRVIPRTPYRTRLVVLVHFCNLLGVGGKLWTHLEDTTV